MIDASGITTALHAQLANIISVPGVVVEREEIVNYDPGVELWVGVYKGEWSMLPKTIGGGGSTRRVQFSPRIIVRSYDYGSVKECDEKLNELVKAVLSAVEDDRTIGGTVATVLGYDVSYQYSEVDQSSLHMQQATIKVTTELRI
jgi:hypothetical protein